MSGLESKKSAGLLSLAVGVIEATTFKDNSRGVIYALSLMSTFWALRSFNLQAHWALNLKGIVAVCAMIAITCHASSMKTIYKREILYPT